MFFQYCWHRHELHVVSTYTRTCCTYSGHVALPSLQATFRFGHYVDIILSTDDDEDDRLDFREYIKLRITWLYASAGLVLCDKAGIPRRRHGHGHGHRHPRRHPREDCRENVGVSFSLPQEYFRKSRVGRKDVQACRVSRCRCICRYHGMRA